MIDPRALVVGVGNALRGDDAVGLVVARRVRAAAPGVAVLESDGEASRLMEAWRGSDRVILVDATVSGAAPGTIVVVDASARPLPAGFGGTSTHAFGLAEAVELARVLDALPRRIVVVGVEGATFGVGAGLSPDVERAVDEATRRVLEALGPRRDS